MAEQTRITLVCVSLRGGGTERVVSRLADHLAASHDVSIVTLAPRQPFFPLRQSVTVVQPELPEPGSSRLVRYIRQLAHLYARSKEQNADLCLVFGEDIAGAVTIISRLAGIGRVWVFLRGTPARSLQGRNGVLNPRILRLAERIFLQTEAGKQALSASYPASKLTVWPNPVKIPGSVSSQEHRKRLIVNIGSIGRLKNQAALLRIFEQLESSGDWQLLFVGDGPERAALMASVSTSAAASRIWLEGEQKNVAPYLNRAAIFAFTSLSEGFPNALAEAMAAGCACISYECPTGPSELIEHGVNGFLIEPGDETEYTRLLQRLVDDAELRARFSRNARESMARFDAAVVMGRLEEMIEEAINGGRVDGLTG